MNHKNMTAGHSLFDGKLLRAALWGAVCKLSPRTQWANPVMFVVYLGAMLTSVLWMQGLMDQEGQNPGFTLAIALWLWFTVLFANFAEALAEGRSRAQAESLRGMKQLDSCACQRVAQGSDLAGGSRRCDCAGRHGH
jgi:K+-transporting ATPase ATPase B chain